MKCEACLSLLEEFVDSELAGREAEQVGTHLMGCVTCAAERELLSAELEIYSRYDRTLTISPAMWSAIAERAAPANEVAGTIARTGLSARFASLFRMPALGLSFAGALVVLLRAAIGRLSKDAQGNGAHRSDVRKDDKRIAPAPGKNCQTRGSGTRIAPVKTESHKKSLAKNRFLKQRGRFPVTRATTFCFQMWPTPRSRNRKHKDTSSRLRICCAQSGTSSLTMTMQRST